MKMSLFREIPPTAGLPVFLNDIISLRKAENRLSSLEEDFKNLLNVEFVKIVYSGTTALYLILEALKDLSGKKTVVIPSFVCPLVPLAIKRAGLNVEICDINGFDFNFNQQELKRVCSENSDVLAIITVHLGGIPLDFEPIRRIAQDYKIFTIEDCAQSLGAEYKGKKVGGLGDFSFFSLCRGKGLTIYEGGVIIVNKVEHRKVVENKIEKLVKKKFLSETLKIFELFGHWLFYRPSLFWFVFRLPKVFWAAQRNINKANIEYFELNFDTHNVSKIRKIIGHSGFHRVEKEIARQREKADYYIRSLEELPGIKIVKERPGDRASYPFVTVIFDKIEKKKGFFKIFENSGLGVSQIYGAPITRYDYLKGIIPEGNFPGGEYLAEREVTLSTSMFIKEAEMDKLIKYIIKL